MHLEDNPNKLRIATEVFIICKQEILLFQREPTSKVFPGYWSIPGGHIDFGEDPLTACVREIKEETGLVVTETDVKLKYISYHYHLDRKETWNIFGFFVSVIDKNDVVNSGEGIAKWVSLQDVEKTDLFPPVAYYLKRALNSGSGLLYSVSEWEKAKLVKVLSEKRDPDY